MTKLLAITGVVVAVIVGLLVFQISRLEKKLDTKNETIGIQAASIASLQATVDYQQESARKAREHQNELEQLRQTHAGHIESVSNQLAMERAKNYSLALQVPLDAGDNITRWLAWWMCEVERAGSDSSGTCDIHTPVSEDAAVNFAQVHTPGVARDMEVACEQGVKDACEYVLVAFTWDGWHNLQNYLMRNLLATQALYANDKYFRKVLSDGPDQSQYKDD